MILLYILFTYFLINLLFFVKRLDNKTKPRIELKKTQIVTYAFSNRYITVENNKIYLLLFLILGPISYFFCDKIKNKRTISILKEEIVNIKSYYMLLYNYSELEDNVYLKDIDKLNRRLKLELLKYKKYDN